MGHIACGYENAEMWDHHLSVSRKAEVLEKNCACCKSGRAVFPAKSLDLKELCIKLLSLAEEIILEELFNFEILNNDNFYFLWDITILNNYLGGGVEVWNK